MKCSKCDATVHTVGEVRRCGGCQDQTAQQIPGDMADETTLEDAIALKEGLGNRFKAGGDPKPEPAPAPQMADEVAAEPMTAAEVVERQAPEAANEQAPDAPSNDS